MLATGLPSAAKIDTRASTVRPSEASATSTAHQVLRSPRRWMRTPSIATGT